MNSSNIDRKNFINHPSVWHAVVIIAFALCGIPLHAGAATFTNFDPPGSVFTYPVSINNSTDKSRAVELNVETVGLTLNAGRPSIALASAFLLDSSASSPVRDSLANALAEAVGGLDINRDTVAIVSTAQTTSWEQATFTTSADSLKRSLDAVILDPPNDAAASLEQVSGVLRALNAQPHHDFGTNSQGAQVMSQLIRPRIKLRIG